MAFTFDFDFHSYEAARRDFRWDLPDAYNITADCIQKHDQTATALEQAYESGARERYSFRDLDDRSAAFARALESLGVERGDRVAVVSGQRPETLVTHLACWRLGAVSVPISTLEGTEGLRYRLRDSDTRVAVVASGAVETVEAIRDDLTALEHVVPVDERPFRASADRFRELCESHPTSFPPVDTTVDTPAVVIYTSGTTGRPKGALHGHGVWLGSLPGFNMYFQGRTGAGTVFYTTSDWSWIAGLGNVVVPAWHYGRPAVGFETSGFDPERALGVMAEFDVTNVYLPPTVVRMMRESDASVAQDELAVEVVGCGGEAVTADVHEWVESELGATLNESYGQTEANVLVSNRGDWFEPRIGSMGKPVPGHEVAVVDPETGNRKPTGEVGQIAVKRSDDPMVFEGYLDAPELTDATTLGDWHLTGDLARRDADGYVWFEGRADDVVVTSGYRVSPVEVERILLEHEAVTQAHVTGAADPERGEILVAYLETPVAAPDDALRRDIREYARDHLAAYKYPRRIEFVAEHETTVAGKIDRSVAENESESGGHKD
ncbi:MAG: acyl-CoA synthetase [Haloplanus sp.]